MEDKNKKILVDMKIHYYDGCDITIDECLKCRNDDETAYYEDDIDYIRCSKCDTIYEINKEHFRKIDKIYKEYVSEDMPITVHSVEYTYSDDNEDDDEVENEN